MPRLQSTHILIIEDEHEIADVVSFSLSRAGFVCQHALSAAQGLAILDDGIYDLLILDVGLPDMDGFDCLKKLRRSSQIPVIMLTAHHDEIDRVLGLELGADDYIGKPFSPRELVARVKTVLKRCMAAHDYAAPISVDTLIYDVRGQQVLFEGQALPLTITELRILTHMLAHPNQVFAREQLLNTAFSANHPSDPRTIDAHIKALRHKLREAGCVDEVIVTHRALGYSLRKPR